MLTSPERELLFADRAVSREILKEVLTESDARRKGVVRYMGSGTTKSDVRCALSILFRDVDVLPKTGEHHLTVARKELMVMFQPGIKPPTFLKARIELGDEVEIFLRVAMERAFLSVKNEGIFEVSYLNALRQIIHRFISSI